MTTRKLLFLLSIFLNVAGLFAAFPSHSSAQPDEDRKFLLMYFKEEELVVESPTRSRKSLTQVAENMTVVTAADIRLMNAHTVADALNAITGVQVLATGGPGSAATISIQGSESRHVAVFIDGVPLNNLSNNVTDVGSLPVQNIEKIEIIKGPASSAWGSALGGVVNIITKSGSGNGPGGVVSASYGERNTGDFRVETSGKQDRFGYYVNAGRLQTDGFKPHNDVSGNNAYTKLTCDITRDTSVFFTLGYDRISRGEVAVPSQDLFRNDKLDSLSSTLSMTSTFNEETGFQFSLWTLRETYDFTNNQLSSGAVLSNENFTDEGDGASAKVLWKRGSHNIVLGADYDARKLESNTLASGVQKLTKSAFFVNDTMSFYRLSVTPGLRQDRTNTNGDFTSPSLGLTYKIADGTLLRAYTAHGFNIPPLSATNINPDLKMEKVRSYELGAETAALQYLLLKLSGFRHDIRDAIGRDAITGNPVNSEKQERQGMEVEMKTAPVHSTSVSAGASFIRVRDLNTGETVPNNPQRTYDLGLQYDDEIPFKALLKGHYIYWNTAPSPDPSFQGKSNAFIFDLHLAKNLRVHDKQMIEAFVDVHNIFDSSQYPLAVFRNPGRWTEAGVRYAF